MRLCATVPAVLVLLAGCNADLTRLCDYCAPKGEHGGQVRVRAAARHHHAGGVTEVPEDLSDLRLLHGPELELLPDGGGGAPRSTPERGTATFSDVSDGPYVLTWAADSFVSTAAEVDLGYDVLGRADVRIADAGLKVSISVDGGLPPGEYHLVSPNSGYFAFELEPFVNPSAGTLSFDYRAAYGGPAPLIDAAKGDVAWLQHLERGTLDGGARFSALRRAGELQPLVPGGGGLSAEVHLPPLPQQSFDFEWDRSGWEAVRTQVHPEARLAGGGLFLGVLPFGADAGVYSSTPDLVTIRANAGEPVVGSVRHGNPFPAGWPLITYVVQDYTVSQGLHTVTARSVQISLQRAGRFELTLSPPRAVRVEGAAPNTSVTTEEELVVVSWAPPERGVATYYRVDVLQGGALSARFHTAGTRLVVPKGLLAEGQYVFKVAAVSDAPANPVAAPYRTALPLALAEAVSGIVVLR